MKHYFIFVLLVFISSYTFSQKWIELKDSVIRYNNSSEYEKARMFGEKAIAAAKQEFGENHPNYATSLIYMALLYKYMGEYEKAEPLFLQAIEIEKNAFGAIHPNIAMDLNDLGVLYQTMGQYEKAEPLLIQVVEIRKKVLGESNHKYASSLNNLAVLYHYMGQYEKAELIFLQALNITKKELGENNTEYASQLINLATLYKVKGQYEKAEPLYSQSIGIIRKVSGENTQKYALILGHMALLYRTIGQFEKAEPMYIKASEIYKKISGENLPGYTAILTGLAELYRVMGQYEKTITIYSQVLEIRRRILGENHPDYATSLNNAAKVFQDFEQYERAEPLYIKAIGIRKNVLGENHPAYANSLNNLANLYIDLNEYENAESLINQAIGIHKNVLGETHPDYADDLNNLAVLYQDMGKSKKAVQIKHVYNEIVLENIKNTFTILSEKEKGNYLNNNTIIIESNNSLLYNYRKASDSFIITNFNLQLFFKSLSLADTRNMLETVHKSRDSSVSHLFNEWQINKRLLANQYSMPLDKRRRDLGAIEAQTEIQEKELTRRSSEFRKQDATLQISMQDVRKNLQQDEAAIEFVRFRLYNKKWTDSTIYAAYILRKNDTVPVFVPLCEEKQLQRIFDSSGSTATSMAGNLYRGITIKVKKSEIFLGRELFNLIWQPMEPYLRGINKIAYSPAGKIYNVALQALPMDSVSVLMDKYQLQQYTSTRQVVLRNAENRTSKPGSIVLFGDASFTMDSLQLLNKRGDKQENLSTSIYTPKKRGSDKSTWDNLPGTAEEVKKIKQQFDQGKINTKSFVQTSATEENLKLLNGQSPEILHIATHGFFLPEPGKKKMNAGIDQGNSFTLADDPLLRSGLMFAGCNYAWSGKEPIKGVEDGIATAYEISQLNLSKTELVVLSACETALGDVKGSEGVFGLQRAFKMAGVKKMIVSLWQVPDKETAELMTTFYSNWLNGKTVAESFYNAQAEMRKKYPPYYWAAFVLVE